MIFRHIINTFGEEKTARVASYGTIASKGVIDDVGRHLRIQWEKTHENADKDKCPWSLKRIDKIKQEFSADEEGTKNKYKELFYYYDGLLGTKVSQSVHPAGIVISPITLNDHYGVFDKEGENCLMMDMEEAHEVGIAKYDFLILKTVQVIRDTCRALGVDYPKTHEINWNDQAVWADMLKSPVGIFQMESKFAFDSLKKYKPTNIFEMSLVTASIRPSGASYRDDLLARKVHKNPSELIDTLLSDNNGFLCYQEDIIKFLQLICGLSGSEADTVRRGIARKRTDILDKMLPQIIEGYCGKSDKPRDVAEDEAKEFLQIIEDASEYMFGYNHSIAYCLLGYLCAYYRYYYPIEFITAFLNNAANDSDITGGTTLAGRYGIKITQPKFGLSKADYFYSKSQNIIAKGLASIKYMSASVANELYVLSKSKHHEHFIDLLIDLKNETSLDSRQLDILIKIDYFSAFGNQKELLRINEIFQIFKEGEAKMMRKDRVDGTGFEHIVRQYSRSTTKSGADSKSYTLLDTYNIMIECEKMIRDMQLDDLGILMKFRNFNDVMGYAGYVSGADSDRNKLYIRDVFPVMRKRDGKLFAYNVLTQSVGSGKESSMTVFKTKFESSPLKKGDIIVCKQWSRDGKYFRMNDYERVYM